MLDPMYGNMASPDYSNDPLRRSDMVGSGSNKKTVKTTTTTTTTRDGASTTPNATSDIAKNGNGDIIQKAPTKDESLASSISAIHGDGNNNNNNNNNHKKNANANAELATVTQVFSFCQTTRCRCFLALAFLCAMISGACMPALAFYFATAFEKLAGSVINNTSSGGGEDSDTSDAAFMQTIRQVAFSFMALGAIVFTSMTCQAMLMETVANEMTIALQTSWFRALLRQDMTYHDIQNNGTGEASIVHTNGAAFKKGVGRKLAEAVQFTTTFIASLAYSFYASWQTTLAVLAISPIMFLSMLFLVNLSTTQTKRANASYSRAGSIVATAISAIRTILALNATDTVLLQYQSATADARRGAIRQVWLYGLANGGQMASMLLSYMIIVTFGTWLLYNQTRENGCDPSGTIVDNEICNPSAVDVFGSLMAVGIAAGVLPQVSVAIESFTGARAACFPAIVAMQRRTVGNSSNRTQSNNNNNNKKAATSMPEYKIDSSSEKGKKPSNIVGQLAFDNVSFAYPTRSEVNVFQNFNLEIKPGTTIALVGPSGQGKSTAMSLIERFYDPQQGSVTLDGIDLRELNVKWLRRHIGYVPQEPKLFAKSIGENIEAGRPGASRQEIEQAAIKANAHDFIMSFPQGYDTQVGDLGGQLSGGQKQRIAIARVLVKNPKILLLDEATSALDSEAEATVQKALDELMSESNMTTLVIAHRLSTIKNADVIAVLVEGSIVESGSHTELLEKRGHYFRLVEAQSMTKIPAEPKEEAFASSDVSNTDGVSHSVLLQSGSSSEDAPDTLFRFNNVHFRYPSRPETKVFRGLNLSVKRGETLAIVGPSGQGKSTIIALMERFYDPDEGEIELNGTDLRDLNVRYLRDQLGLVSQEPTLFDCSVADNITYGYSGLVTQEHIEEAAKMANAHDFIVTFPQGYNTSVGAGSALVSGGQKQRIALARALFRNPKILLLDEATSALDSESERVVQAALDKVMFRERRTCVVIAHRLSTVRNASRIAVIDNGKVRELGTHDQLMAKGGRYARLVALQDLHAGGGDELEDHSNEGYKHDDALVRSKQGNEEEEIEEEETEVDSVAAKKNAARARSLASSGDKWLFLVGAIGALLAGVVFPAFGFVFAYMIEVLYTPVVPCDDEVQDVWPFLSCQDYYDSVADQMRRRSWKILYAFIVLIACTLVGSTLLFGGFGKASENMNKRVRDSAFASLLRQEVAWFDVHTVGTLTSQLAEDAALIHAFSGEPIRTLVLNLASVLVGVVVSFYFMWPFALLTLAILPFMAFGAEMEMQMYMGDDQGDDHVVPENSPGGIVIETMSNIRTIASLTLEDDRAQEYHHALELNESHSLCTSFVKGCAVGAGQFVQMWGLALMFWWGGWLLSQYGDVFRYRDFLISMMALLFSLYGLAIAAQGAVNHEKAKQAAARIFALIDRKSLIDPQVETGKKQV